LVTKIDDYEEAPKNNISSEIDRVNKDIGNLNLEEKEEIELFHSQPHKRRLICPIWIHIRNRTKTFFKQLLTISGIGPKSCPRNTFSSIK